MKPFVKRQKNDRNDAEAICTALRQPNMRFVPKKAIEQQDIQLLHRARRRLVAQDLSRLTSDDWIKEGLGDAFHSSFVIRQCILSLEFV